MKAEHGPVAHPRAGYRSVSKTLGILAPTQLNGLIFAAIAAPVLFTAALASPAFGQTETSAPASQMQMAFLGVRVLKAAEAGDVQWSAELPSDCNACRLVLNDRTSGQNAKEFFFHAWVPQGDFGSIRIKVDAAKVRGVIASFTDLEMSKRGYATDQRRAIGLATVPFTRQADGIAFTVPHRLGGVSMPPDDLTDVTQDYTYIETPGVYIRIGHADAQRRAGPYATVPWPTREAAAALNLEFATREAIDKLGLVKTLAAKGVQTIMLMNFDTNYPTLSPEEAHADWPPHWHMHLYWKDVPKVRRVGHFYFSNDGLLIANMVSDLKPDSLTQRTERWFQRGEPDQTKTPSGELVYAQTITEEGWFRLSAEHESCLLKPVGDGFDSGATITCDREAGPTTVRAVDDPGRGSIAVYLGGKLSKEYHYNTDTGALRD